MSEYQTPYVSEAAVSLDLQHHKLQQELDRMKETLRIAKVMFEKAEEFNLEHPAKSISDYNHRAIRFRAVAMRALEALK